MKRWFFGLWLLWFGVFPVFASAGEEEICGREVPTAEGPVLGKLEPGGTCSYKGIPFAAPPVGAKRWRRPEPPPRRKEPLRAFAFGAQCIQRGSGTGIPEPGNRPVRSEDCLNLNIWRPAKSGVFPVMVWIHGGSLTAGSGSETLYHGDRLAAEGEVVVVTINYRLSYYGFLALPHLAEEDPDGSAGNYGLLDQVEALKWVQANIAGFGGDPNNVTIFGESAGGWSVCHLLASPLTRGLFHRAILESGGCEVARDLEAGMRFGKEFAAKVGCGGGNPVECLRRKSAAELEKALEQAGQAEKKRGKKSPLSLESLHFDWVPHVDGWALKEKPLAALRAGRAQPVPLLIGTNREEGKLFTITMPGVRLMPAGVLHSLLVKIFGPERAGRIEELYPYSSYRRPLDAVLDALGDLALGCPCLEAAEATTQYHPVYYYRFDFNRHSLPHMVGAAHGLEIPFIFDNLDRPPAGYFLSRGQTKRAKELSRIMMGYWTNFARKADPNGPGLLTWPAYTPETRARMILDLPPRVEPADNLKKCAFWREQKINLTE